MVRPLEADREATRGRRPEAPGARQAEPRGEVEGGGGGPLIAHPSDTRGGAFIGCRRRLYCVLWRSHVLSTCYWLRVRFIVAASQVIGRPRCCVATQQRVSQAIATG